MDSFTNNRNENAFRLTTTIVPPKASDPCRFQIGQTQRDLVVPLVWRRGICRMRSAAILFFASENLRVPGISENSRVGTSASGDELARKEFPAPRRCAARKPNETSVRKSYFSLESPLKNPKFNRSSPPVMMETTQKRHGIPLAGAPVQQRRQVAENPAPYPDELGVAERGHPRNAYAKDVGEWSQLQTSSDAI